MTGLNPQEYLEEYLSVFEAAQNRAGESNRRNAARLTLPDKYLSGGRETFELSGHLPAGVLTGGELLDIIDVAGFLDEPGETAAGLRDKMSEKIIRLKEDERRLAEQDRLLRRQEAELRGFHGSRFFRVYRIVSLPFRAARDLSPHMRNAARHPAYRTHLAGKVRMWLGRGGNDSTGGPPPSSGPKKKDGVK
ncbi:MAG: hypothetical protein WC828_02675 [Thermoleophilia bacterium]|jgi:hypothetical protein